MNNNISKPDNSSVKPQLIIVYDTGLPKLVTSINVTLNLETKNRGCSRSYIYLLMLVSRSVEGEELRNI
jgi:hypothetical protein